MHSISHEIHAVLNHTKDQLSRTLCSQGPEKFIARLPRKPSISPKKKQTVIADVRKDTCIRIYVCAKIQEFIYCCFVMQDHICHFALLKPHFVETYFCVLHKLISWLLNLVYVRHEMRLSHQRGSLLLFILHSCLFFTIDRSEYFEQKFG